MIIYGTKLKHLAHVVVDERCYSCGKRYSVNLSLFQQYFHVFWIPFFPIRKRCNSACGHCKHVMEHKEASKNYSVSYENLKKTQKPLYWMFTGSILFIVLLSIGFYNYKRNERINLQYLSKPKAGDVYEIRTGTFEYSVYKVKSISNDTVYVYASKYLTDKRKEMEAIKKKGPESFQEKPIPLLLKDLPNLYDELFILDVERKN